MRSSSSRLVNKLTSNHISSSFVGIQNIYKCRHLSTKAVQFGAYGNPREVLKLVDLPDKSSSLSGSEVGLKFLAAPINPADINMVEGVYGVKVSSFPSTAGNEGVAEVVGIGSDVKHLKVGDWVVPAAPSFGTWRQTAKVDESQLLSIPNDIPLPYAASLSVNPCTAFRLLRDFERLQPGDVVLQNGANSMVGLAVIQMAREMGLKTVNIVRSDRPDVGEVLRLLTNLGGDINVPDWYFHSSACQDVLRELPPPKLALNSIGGSSATDLCRAMAPNSTIVTYGGMSKQPFSVPFEMLSEKQLTLKGFWISHWCATHSVAERQEMLKQVAEMVRNKKLSFFFEMHDLDDFSFALKKAQEPFQFRKVVLNLNYPDRLVEHDEKTKKDYEVFEAPLL